MNEPILKRATGQSGEDGNRQLRTHRIEIRVSPDELCRVIEHAKTKGYASTAQFVRQQAVSGGNAENPDGARRALLDCHYQLNRLGNNVNQIARHLNLGRSPDEEIHLVLLQIQELAEQLVSDAAKKRGAVQ